MSLLPNTQELIVISGPCVIESYEHTLYCAKMLKAITERTGVQFIFKASYDKANRSHTDSFRGPGIDEGLAILKAIKEELGIAITTDIHKPDEAQKVADVCDLIQIPAFLSRQTDLLYAAADTGIAINVKKGQFMAPEQMENVVSKIRSRQQGQWVMATDRGYAFGYGQLINDMCSYSVMGTWADYTCIDASHSAQIPSAMKETQGARWKIPILAQAGVAAGAHALFIETHPHPEKALSDAQVVYPLDHFEQLLEKVVRIYRAQNGYLT